MTVQRYQSDSNVDTTILRKPLDFHFSKRTISNRIFKASMGETLASWAGADSQASGVPTKEIVELYKRYVIRNQ